RSAFRWPRRSLAPATRSSAATSTPPWSTPSTPASRRSPARPGSPRRCRRRSARGACARARARPTPWPPDPTSSSPSRPWRSTAARARAGVRSTRRSAPSAMGSAEAAELAKLAETTYRDVNIAFANELARIADDHGLDVARAIEGANSQPFSHIHQPGVAVGGHCIPVYPRFLLAGAPDARLPRVAREINEAMPGYVVDLLGEVAGRRVLVLGVTYRGGVKETAFSGALALRDELQARGATEVLGHDPLLSDAELEALDFLPWPGD